MKTSAITNGMKTGAIKSIAFTGAVLHTSLTTTAMAIQGTAELVADGEAFLTNKVDGTKSKEEIKLARQMHTAKLIYEASEKVNQVNAKAKELVATAKDKTAEVIDSAKQLVKKPAQSKEKTIVLEPTKTGKFYVLVDNAYAKTTNEDGKEYRLIFADEAMALEFATGIM